MSVESAPREMVKAIAVGDSSRAQELNRSMPNDERGDFYNLLAAFFALMLEQRFADDASHEAIRTFVEEIRYDYRDADPPIKPLIFEGALRAACGEEHLLTDISQKDLDFVQHLVIRKVALQSDQVIPKINAFLDEAQQLVAEWRSDS